MGECGRDSKRERAREGGKVSKITSNESKMMKGLIVCLGGGGCYNSFAFPVCEAVIPNCVRPAWRFVKHDRF